MDPERFLGGKMKGDRALAEKALQDLGDALGLSALDTAIGIHRIIDTQMAVGLRLTLEAKGCDASTFVLVPFGGAGPVHAWRIAESVGIPRLLVPASPGIGCAMGLLETDVVHLYMQSAVSRIDQTDPGSLEQVFAGLMERARADSELEGFAEDEVRIFRELDIRYPHQGYELAMECPDGPLDSERLEALRLAFDQRHVEVYGTSAPDEPVEIVNARVRTVVQRSVREQMESVAGTAASPDAAQTGTRDVHFESLGGFVPTPVYDRAALEPRMTITGPAIIEQLDATTVVGPGWSGAVDQLGNLPLTREDATKS
jgi:N-methylhydantoinase A